MSALENKSITAQWQALNEQWAERRCRELCIPYRPLWTPGPHVTRELKDEERDVYLQWAEMEYPERVFWGEKYRELDQIPRTMLEQERKRLKRMRAAELERRSHRAFMPEDDDAPRRDESPAEFTLTSAAQVA